jgi:hypothetical protein
MKKITTLVSAFLFTLAIQAQEVNLKPEYKQNTTYTQTALQSNVIEIAYEGAEEPMVQESGNTVVSTTKVGKLANGEMPVVVEMSMDKDQEGAAMINGAKIHGKVKPGSKPVFERVEAPNMPDEVKGMIQGMMDQGLSSIFIPAKKVKVGESFVQETPLEIPLGPVTMKMKDVATYKLNKVEGRKAIFAVDHVFSLEANVEGQDMKGSGTGTGEMVYDMDQNYPVRNDAKVTMSMAFEAQGMQMNIKTTNDTKTTTVIAPTK